MEAQAKAARGKARKRSKPWWFARFRNAASRCFCQEYVRYVFGICSNSSLCAMRLWDMREHGTYTPKQDKSKKIADYFGISVEELMGTKKEPAGQGELEREWADIEVAYKSATPEARAAAKAAALAVLESSKKEG